MKKIISFVLTAIFAMMTLTVSASAAVTARAGKAGYSSNWELWSQGGSSYSIMRQVGCRTVAYSKLLAETGYAPSNPDSIYWFNKNNGYVTSGYAELAQHTGKIPEYYTNGQIKLVSKVALNTTSKQNGNNQIMSYLKSGYYVILAGPTHTTYVLRNASINAGQALISDSWSSWAYSDYANRLKYTSYNLASFRYIWLYKSTAPQNTQNTYTAYVKNTDGSLAINARACAGNRVGVIPEGASCTIYPDKSTSNWLYVSYNGVCGYAYKYYLTTQAPATRKGRISGTDGSLAINSKPSANSRIGLIPEGAECTVYTNIRKGNWVWVSYGNVYGYAYSRYIK